jgi:hypothetical protein
MTDTIQIPYGAAGTALGAVRGLLALKGKEVTKFGGNSNENGE